MGPIQASFVYFQTTLYLKLQILPRFEFWSSEYKETMSHGSDFYV